MPREAMPARYYYDGAPRCDYDAAAADMARRYSRRATRFTLYLLLLSLLIIMA